MSDLQRVGSVFGGAGTAPPFTAVTSGAQRVSDAHGRYMDAVMAGRVYFMSLSGAAATAYTGGAAGTPLLAIHNPTGSQKLLVVLGVGISGRAQASAAGTVGFDLWSGVSVLPTGTVTPPRNAMSLLNSGAAAVGFSNTALTGSTALTVAMPLFTYYWATAAGAILSPSFFDVGGLVIAAPGNQIALGASAALTSATYDVALYWEEIPFLPTN